MVLLAFLTANDISDNSKEFNVHGLQARPYYVEEGTSFVLDQSFLSTVIYRQRTGMIRTVAPSLSDKVLLLQFFYRAKNYLQRKEEEEFASALSGRPAIEAGLDQSIYEEPAQQSWKSVWNITEYLLRTIHNELTLEGFVLCSRRSPKGIQVLPDPKKRLSLIRELQVKDLFYSETRLHQRAEREGFEFIALAPVLQQYAETHQEYLHGFKNTMLGFGHWNERGHQAAGEYLTKYFCARPN